MIQNIRFNSFLKIKNYDTFTLTTNQSTRNDITLSLALSKYYKVYVDWGDGNSTTLTRTTGYNVGHAYSTRTTFTITIKTYLEEIISLTTNGSIINVILTKLTNLTSLDLSQNQTLTSVNVLSNTKLTNLNLTNCDLTSLNISNLNKLTHLYIDSNIKMSSLTLSNNSELFYVTCNNAWALGAVDFTNCTRLNTISFIDSYALYSLNLTNCSSLSYIDGSRLKFKTLDVSTCNNLYRISLVRNSLTSDGINSILSKLVSNTIDEGRFESYSMNAGLPTGQGLIDKSTLISRGWVVTTSTI